MTIETVRLPLLGTARHACDRLADDMARFYRVRPAVRNDVTLLLELVRPRAVVLAYMRTLNRGRGLASATLDALIAAADAHDVSLGLEARASTETPGYLEQSALESFYARRGFEITGRRPGSTAMRRLAPCHMHRSTIHA